MGFALPPLPRIMVAPNGARRTKRDHPQLPMTIAETVKTAQACHAAGADGLHAHVRDENGAHVLDAGLYRELLDEMQRAVPDMACQITTEAVGRFSPAEQRAVVRRVAPSAVSISVREMLSEGESAEVSAFYHEQADAGCAIQHILYGVDDGTLLRDLCERDVVPMGNLQLLFVLGRYTEGQQSRPQDLDPFVTFLRDWEASIGCQLDWACCAFGMAETACLSHAIKLGGKARIGFENNLHHADGRLATDNADRVAALLSALAEKDL